MVEDTVTAIISRPETWGGLAAAASFGWFQAERARAKQADHFRQIMDRMADVLFRAGKS